MGTFLRQNESLPASILSGGKTLTILTAPSGAGKTTFCAHLAAQARQSGLSVGGFVCPAVFENGKKVGIDMLDLASGQRRRLARRSLGETDATIGCWQMDEQVLAWGNEIISTLKNEDLIVIDELGPLELEQGQGYWQALQLLDEGCHCKALVVVRPALLPLAQMRWRHARIVSLEALSS